MIPIDDTNCEEEDGWMGEIGRIGMGGFGCGHTLLVIYGMSCFLKDTFVWVGKMPPRLVELRLGWVYLNS